MCDNLVFRFPKLYLKLVFKTCIKPSLLWKTVVDNSQKFPLQTPPQKFKFRLRWKKQNSQHNNPLSFTHWKVFRLSNGFKMRHGFDNPLTTRCGNREGRDTNRTRQACGSTTNPMGKVLPTLLGLFLTNLGGWIFPAPTSGEKNGWIKNLICWITRKNFSIYSLFWLETLPPNFPQKWKSTGHPRF